eukprot:gene16734-18429_t
MKKIKLPSALLRIVLLIALFHVYVALMSLIFQSLEKFNGNDNKVINEKFVQAVKLVKAESKTKSDEVLAKKLRQALDEKFLKDSIGLQTIEDSYIYTLTSSVILGNSGFELTTWQSRLFYIFTIPFGFALYVIIIISLAYHIRNAMQACVTLIEKKDVSEISLVNSKILAISLATCFCVLQICVVAVLFRNRSYLYGLYLSMDLLTFIGNETILERGQAPKVYYSLLLGFYLMLLHSVLFTTIASFCHAWKEICNVYSQRRRQISFFQPKTEPVSQDYKEKLLASFESYSSSTVHANEAVDDVYFPQFHENENDFLFSDGLQIADEPYERRESHFSEIFNAQKNNFEPIEEGMEYCDANVVEVSSEKAVENSSDNKEVDSSIESFLEEKDVLQNKHPREEMVYYFNERDLKPKHEDVERLLTESRGNSPRASTVSLPSSYTNISLNDWGSDDDYYDFEDETLSATKVEEDLDSTLLEESNSTIITQK